MLLSFKGPTEQFVITEEHVFVDRNIENSVWYHSIVSSPLFAPSGLNGKRKQAELGQLFSKRCKERVQSSWDVFFFHHTIAVAHTSCRRWKIEHPIKHKRFLVHFFSFQGTWF